MGQADNPKGELNPINILDPQLGAKLRAVIVSTIAVLTAVTGVIQAASSVLDSLPNWRWVGAVGVLFQGAIVILARWSKVGNKYGGNTQ